LTVPSHLTAVSRRQPVHTVYGGAHLFKADIAPRLGARALQALEEHAADAASFARAIGMSTDGPPPPRSGRVATRQSSAGWPVRRGGPARRDLAEARRAKAGRLARTIYDRVLEKLGREPVEDFRIDFEDGFGTRSDEEEDRVAEAAARETAAGLAAGQLPPFVGIRIKSFSGEARSRAARTLDIYVTTLAGATGGALPPHFAVTLPKITAPDQVSQLADACHVLETRLPIAAGSLRMELMIETPQSIFDAQGRVAPPHLVAAGRGRVVAAHFGTYDYTASLDITAAHQHMTHAACDFARHVLQVGLAGTGIWLSDGATNILPVGAGREVVHRAWKLHYDHIRHSLAHAYYQGWDLHPAQLPTRYAAVYAFFLEGLDEAAERLRTFVERAAQATLVGDVFDDAATGQGLLNFFLRAINCGAISEVEATEKTGLTIEELRSRSFTAILQNRT
jgi:citrate lyase beta subunit